MKRNPRYLLLLLLSIFIITGHRGRARAGEIELVRYPAAGGGDVKALYIHPDKGGRAPAVIFNHGAIVEYRGLDEARRLGYDIDSYLAALAGSGFAAIAPIRDNQSGLLPDDILAGCMRYLASKPDIDSERVGMVGFSRGGAITYMEAGAMNLKAVVLMSPAGIRGADREVAEKIKRLRMPVFLTLGDQRDNREIVKFCTRTLIPLLKAANANFAYKTGYPGDHKWFWKARDEHWPDVEAFLIKHLH